MSFPELPILARRQGSSHQFILMTLPLLGVMIYFLFQTYQRPKLPIYNMPQQYTQAQWTAAVKQSGFMVRLLDILLIFLALQVFWTAFAVYMISFVSKRRHLIGRYLAEGELCLGDVIHDKRSKICARFNEYGYAVYAHPNQRVLVRKRVRVYQPYTRERIAILRLPNRPLSGQSKIDLEIDLSAATKERDTSHKPIVQWCIFWVLFTLFGPIYVLYQMQQLDDPINDDVQQALQIFLIVVGLNVPFAFLVNWTRFLMYRNWMINRGAIIEDNGDARKIDHCMQRAQSEAGSDVIPYSILNEEEMSYQGSLPSHNLSYQGSLPSHNLSMNSKEYTPPQTDSGGVRTGPNWVTLS